MARIIIIITPTLFAQCSTPQPHQGPIEVKLIPYDADASIEPDTELPIADFVVCCTVLIECMQ